MTREDILRILNSHARFINDSNGDSIPVIRQGYFSRVADEIFKETSSLCIQLTEMTAEKNKWFDSWVGSIDKIDTLGETIHEREKEIEELESELKVMQKKMEVLASMINK